MNVHARLLLVATLLLSGCAKSEPLDAMKVSLTHETPGGEYVLCAHVTPDGEFEVSSFPGGRALVSMSGSVKETADAYGVSIRYEFRDAPAESGGEGLLRTEINTQVKLKGDEWLKTAITDNETIAIRIGR